MKFTKALLALAAALVCTVGNANAQTAVFVAGGSSALYLEVGQATVKETLPGNATPASCVWSQGSNSADNYLTDTRVGVKEAGAMWVTWTPGTGGTCASPDPSTSKVYAYMSLDSTVGDRCLLASPSCTLTMTNVLNGGSNQLAPENDTDTGLLPTGVFNALNGASMNVAGTDIRPEDAKFATIRALTDCGVPVNGVSDSQYLGLGYAQTAGSHLGVPIVQSSEASGGNATAFNVFDFNLIGNDPISGSSVASYSVYDVGAVPIVVFVNPGNASPGFGSLQVGNITRQVLAGYLDGTYGRTTDIVGQAYSGTANGTTVFIREPLSGTYNTMEYNIPNSLELKTSQDVSYTSINSAAGGTTSTDPDMPNCSATPGFGVAGDKVFETQMESATTSRSGASPAHSNRYRAIGTGNMVKSVIAVKDSLGYAFWGTGNFKSALATNAKYLTVDGADPIQAVWSDGLVPTALNGLLGDVSFANIKNGAYPIWSRLRLVGIGTGATVASQLAAVAQNYVGPLQPDFVPISQLSVLRSHFAPPYNSSSAYNADFPSSGADVPENAANYPAVPPATGVTYSCTGTTEAGGDVGGAVITVQSDGDYCKDLHVSTGSTGHRQ